MPVEPASGSGAHRRAQHGYGRPGSSPFMPETSRTRYRSRRPRPGAMRDRGVTVIHVQVGFRPGMPEISSRNALFAAIRTSERHQQLFKETQAKFIPRSRPWRRTSFIVKHRISAFTGNGSRHDPAREGNRHARPVRNRDQRRGSPRCSMPIIGAIVIKDCCADQDADVHSVLLEKVFSAPRYCGDFCRVAGEPGGLRGLCAEDSRGWKPRVHPIKICRQNPGFPISFRRIRVRRMWKSVRFSRSGSRFRSHWAEYPEEESVLSGCRTSN